MTILLPKLGYPTLRRAFARPRPLPMPRVRDYRHPTDDEVCRALRSVPRHYAGDIKLKYGTATALTVTNLHSLASSSTLTAGWISAAIDNTSNLYDDAVFAGEILVGTSPTAGEARAYFLASYDGSTWPAIFTGTYSGSEGTLTLVDTEQVVGLIQVWSTDIDNATNDPYSMPPRSVLQAYGFMPRKYALWVTHNTVAALKSSGNAMYHDGSYAQYT